MKTVTSYIADDGTAFDSKEECLAYEAEQTTSKKLEKLITDSIQGYRLGVYVSAYDVRRFIENHINEINDILNVVQTEESGWISNVGRGACGHPDNLDADTLIEVQYRSGTIDKGFPSDWNTSWRETDGLTIDIVAYRIL